LQAEEVVLLVVGIPATNAGTVLRDVADAKAAINIVYFNAFIIDASVDWFLNWFFKQP
jgi:hypothetical protein